MHTAEGPDGERVRQAVKVLDELLKAEQPEARPGPG